MLRLNMTFLVIFFALKSYALVDLKNANFADAWVDLNITGTGYDLKVQRGYNSRTLYNGIFGFGWCSDFETFIDVTAEGNLKLSECGAGMEVLYEAKGFSERDIDSTVKKIIQKVKSENSQAQPSYFTSLEARLKTETALRAEYAGKYKISRGVADKTRYYANGKETDYIEKIGDNYVRLMPDGSIQKFKLNGKLEKLFDRNGNYLVFGYDGKHLKDITDNNGRKLTLSYYDNGKVKTIVGPGNIKAEYKYKNLNDLIYVKSAYGNVYTYSYDDLHNMTKVVFPDKSTKEMTYNKNKDWVTSFKDTDGCSEKYDYLQSQEDPKNHYWATVEKRCQGKLIVKAKYEFWYEMKTDQTGKFLKKSRTQENDLVTDVAYNELGKPLAISRKGKSTRFEYYDNGLLRKKTTPDGVTTTLYYDNAFKKVSKVVRAGKVSEFEYDKKGNLVKANNNDGQKINLTYDNKGRVATIEDQAKRKVSFKYDERFGKPSLIEREGVGSISLVYNSKGEFIKAQPNSGGETAAKQVASTFYNLVELTQVAGVTLSF